MSALEQKVSALEKEKEQLSSEKVQLKGQLDLAKAEAAKNSGGSKGCQVQ